MNEYPGDWPISAMKIIDRQAERITELESALAVALGEMRVSSDMPLSAIRRVEAVLDRKE